MFGFRNIICLVSLLISSCGLQSSTPGTNVTATQFSSPYPYNYCGTLKRTRLTPTFGGQGFAEMKVQNNVSSQSLTIEGVTTQPNQFLQNMAVGSYSYVCVSGNAVAGPTIDNAYVFNASQITAIVGNSTVSW